MKNTLIAMIAIFFLGLGFVSATPVSTCDPLNPAFVSGTVYDQSHVAVPGASVTVDCDTQTGYANTNALGDYEICFNATLCNYGDALHATATKTGVGTGQNDTETMCNARECVVPIGIVDVTIPEFGVIAGAVALVGALGIFIYRRKN